MATRYEKLAVSFIAFVKLAFIRYYLKLDSLDTAYSVSFSYIGQKVLLHYPPAGKCLPSAPAYCSACQRPVSHRYTTPKEHLPSTHQYVSEWSEAFFLEQAERIDSAAGEFITGLLASRLYPKQVY